MENEREEYRQLFFYYLEETNRRLETIETKIDRLSEFRAETVGRAKAASAVISIIVSLISMILSKLYL